MISYMVGVGAAMGSQTLDGNNMLIYMVMYHNKDIIMISEE